jgi:hypothetical protein
MKNKTNQNNINPGIGYRVYADKAFMDFLRPMREEKFTKMDAYCYLLDKALANASSNSTDGKPSCENPFVITVTNLAETWNWHRATVRSFLDELVSRDRMTRRAQTKSYLISMKLGSFNPVLGCPYAVVIDDSKDVAAISTSSSGQMSTSEQDRLYDYSDEDMLHIFFCYMASMPNAYEILAKDKPVNLLHAFNVTFCNDPQKHQLAVSILARSMQQSIAPGHDADISKLSEKEGELLDRIYLRYICRRCATANCNS